MIFTRCRVLFNFLSKLKVTIKLNNCQSNLALAFINSALNFVLHGRHSVATIIKPNTTAVAVFNYLKK